MIAVSVAAAVTFNLVCPGSLITGDIGELPGLNPQDRTPTTTILRVDLAKQRWCIGTCETTKPIYRVTETAILFEVEEDKEAGSDLLHMVNREDGSYLNRSRFSGIVLMTIGKCERAPFSGFPALKF